MASSTPDVIDAVAPFMLFSPARNRRKKKKVSLLFLRRDPGATAKERGAHQSLADAEPDGHSDRGAERVQDGADPGEPGVLRAEAEEGEPWAHTLIQ